MEKVGDGCFFCKLSKQLRSALLFCAFRFPMLSPLKSFPTRPPFRDSSDLPRLIRWDDYEELPQQENTAPIKSAVLVRKRQTCFSKLTRGLLNIG